MRRLLTIAATLGFAACGTTTPQSAEGENAQKAPLTLEQIKALSFVELFTAADVNSLGQPFAIGEDFSVLTAGDATHYNSMVASWGGWGILFDRPSIYHFLRSNRYTLELMRKDNTYTVSLFPAEYKEQIMIFGGSSGRDSNKMKETTLTAVATPSGNMTYKEAAVVLECKLAEVTTVSPDDFINESDKKFVVDAHAETGEYHKMIFSEITNVWVRK